MLTSNDYVLDESPARLGKLDEVPTHERNDREALWNRLRRDGYLLLRGQLPAEVVHDFRRFYFEALAQTGLVDTEDPGLGLAGGPHLDRALLRRVLFDHIIPSPQFQALCTRPEVKNWFEWFLDDEVHLHKRKILRHTQPGENGIGTATQAHYDLVYLREGSDRVLSMWIPLGDCPTTRGGLTYLEGTHQQIMADERAGRLKRPAATMTADLPSLANEYDTRWLVTDYAAGDVVVHSAHIIHAALDNVDTAGVMRLSTDIRYQRVSDPIDWRWQQHWNDQDGL